MRITFLLICLVALARPAGADELPILTGLYATGGLSLSQLDASGDSIDLESARYRTVELSYPPTGPVPTLMSADPYGYNLETTFFTGYHIGLGYRFGKWVSVNARFDHFFAKSGSQGFSWIADPGTAFPNHSGLIEYDATYSIDQWTGTVEVFPGLAGLFVTAGGGIVSYDLEETHNSIFLVNSLEDSTSTVTTTTSDDESFFTLGAGYEYVAGRSTSLVGHVGYVFNDIEGGVRIHAGLRFYPFELGR